MGETHPSAAESGEKDTISISLLEVAHHLTASVRSRYTLGSWFLSILMEVPIFSNSSTCSAIGPIKFLDAISSPGILRSRLVFCWSKGCLCRREGSETRCGRGG